MRECHVKRAFLRKNLKNAPIKRKNVTFSHTLEKETIPLGTTFEQLECAAMTYIKNDLSLDWDLKNRLPVFYRRMWNYMQAAIPLFNKPTVMLTRLHAYTEPEYSDVLFTVSEVADDGTVTIETGITEMDICSAGIITTDEFGNPQYLPLTVDSYDAETGTVAISGTISVGDEVDIDFYKAGEFTATLNATECDILAFCIYDVWEHRYRYKLSLELFAVYRIS